MQSFLDFIQQKREFSVYEAFNQNTIDKAVEKIDSLLTKHIDGLVPLVGYQKTKSDKQTFWSSQYLIVNGKDAKKTSMFQINWLQSDNSVHAYSIDFFKNVDYLFSGEGKSDLTIYTLGSSIVYFLPIIWTIAASGNYNMSEKKALELGRSIFKKDSVKESEYYVGALKYHLFEELNNSTIFDIFKQTINETDDSVKDFKKKKYDTAHDAYLKRKNSEEDKEKSKKLLDEYNEITAAIKGGASTLQELKLAIKKNVHLVAEIDAEIAKIEKKLKEEHQDPDTVFKKMQQYVKMVIKGVNPSVVLCGAPGVGKTYRVKQQLKASGYNEGHNLFTIKGKCSPRQLYLRLYEYQDKGNIVLIDDADGLVGPGAPEDCINILKAALDSTSDDEGRLVSYGVAGKLMDDEGDPIPKRFYYRGGVIVITNWNAGSLDTALRGRSFIQDINFTAEDILNIIKKLMPEIDKHKLSMKCKLMAFDFLNEMVNTGEEITLSVRTFGICAQIFSCLDDKDGIMTEEIAKDMIREQMKLQGLKGKKKY